MSGDFLDRMCRGSEERARAARAEEPMSALRRRSADLPPPPALTIGRFGFDVIAEIKRRSPAEGALAIADEDAASVHRDIADRAACYARGGACAISVLTEPSRFDGCLSHLSAASAAVEAMGVPVMRKDFLVDPYQIFEARAAGAGGVLLIARALSDERLGEMLDASAEAGLFVLLEAFDDVDLRRSARFLERMPPPPLLGLNTRNLQTLEVDSGRLERYAADFVLGAIPVAESGVANVEDVDRIVRLGYRLALVGTALMRAADPAVLLDAMIRTGRGVLVHDRPGHA